MPELYKNKGSNDKKIPLTEGPHYISTVEVLHHFEGTITFDFTVYLWLYQNIMITRLTSAS